MKITRKLTVASCAAIAVLTLLTTGLSGCSGCSGCSKGGKSGWPGSSGPSEGTLTVTVYAYCPCARCNTRKWKGMLATGQRMKDILAKGKNICAADPGVIPMGATVSYNGKEYLVADTGRRIKGNTINILFRTHREVYKFGVKKDQEISFKKE